MDQSEVDRLLEEAKEHCLELSALCSTQMLPRSGEGTNAVRYRIDTLRQYLLYRIGDLGTSAIRLFRQSALVPALILVRALIETTAVMHVLCDEVEKALEEGKLESIDESIDQFLFGGRAVDIGYKSLNVLTFIDKVTRQISPFRTEYDQLCEFSHPNWSGCMGSYSTIANDGLTLLLGRHKLTGPSSDFPVRRSLHLLTIGLKMGIADYRRMDASMR